MAFNSATAPAAAKKRSVQTKTVEIGAGAKIRQRFYDDPYGLEYWQSTCAGTIVINYVPSDNAAAILAAGEADVSGSDEGFLQNIPVGN